MLESAEDHRDTGESVAKRFHWRSRLRLPVIAAPMFLVSSVDLVVAQCKAGIVGSFPALNARPAEALDGWLTRIKAGLIDAPDAAPFAANLIVHGSNERLSCDLETCVRHEVPIVINSLRPLGEVVAAVHSYGGLVFHDVTTVRHANKALEQGADRLVLVAAGAGGHAGRINPFALLAEVRRVFAGPVALAGAIASGHAILAAQVLGAGFAYVGTRFIATRESNASAAYKQMIVECGANDIVYTDALSGIHGNYLRPSLSAAGIDPDNPSRPGAPGGYASHDHRPKAWRDIWSAGHGVGGIDEIESIAQCVERLQREYDGARARGKPA
jgi:nitronate monooxygenase